MSCSVSLKCRFLALALVSSVLVLVQEARTREPLTPAERGYRLLVSKAYLPADFDQPTFDALWKRWPAPLRERAAAATPEERQEMAFAYYGLTPRPENRDLPLQYVVDKRGHLEEADIQALLEAGYTRQTVLEVVLGVGMKTLSNYTNHIVNTPLDQAFEPMAWSPPKESVAM